MPSRTIRALLSWTMMTTPAAAAAQEAPTLLHPLFQDHGVLQRDRPIAVWGDAAPGADVTVSLAGKQARARADETGHWRATLPAIPAGGPYVLAAEAGGVRARAEDVLIGDVWLCSGQSNMEYPLSRALAAPGEIAGATDPQMRLLTVAKDTSTLPAPRFLTPVAWQAASPATVPDFSAACYFMGRDLRQSQKVPIGLINASWGGTAIDAWRSRDSFTRTPGERERMALLDAWRADPAKASAQWSAAWSAWWRDRTGGSAEPWRADAAGDWKPLPAFEAWEGWGDAALKEFNGLVFYRTEVTLTPAQAREGATLLLSPADDTDMSWVNGTGVGTNTAWGKPRSYALAPGVLKPGRNSIVVGVYDSYGAGGLIGGSAEQRAIAFADGSRVPLPAADAWQYRIAPGDIGEPPRAPWDGIAGLSAIYNGMIAPLGSYGLRGVAWYQGESDAGAARGYAGKLASLMQVWRSQFGAPELPFLIVQLAAWGPRVPAPAESGSARIRDEQRRAVAADAHAGLAVAVDLGEPNDIHPANKQDVGHRLARAARVVAYGSDETPSGPWAVDAVRMGNAVAVRFEQIDGALVTYNADVPIGFELCGSGPGTCRFVPARIEGARVLLDAGSGPAARVRFCWGDSPMCNLYDKAGLPASPFELAVR